MDRCPNPAIDTYKELCKLYTDSPTYPCDVRFYESGIHLTINRPIVHGGPVRTIAMMFFICGDGSLEVLFRGPVSMETLLNKIRNFCT